MAGNQAWQDSGLALAANQTIETEYLSPGVTDANTTIADANGLDYGCDDIAVVNRCRAPGGVP